MNFYGFGQMFEGNFEETLPTNLCWCKWGAEQRVERAQTQDWN
jgi:hypothetical protein